MRLQTLAGFPHRLSSKHHVPFPPRLPTERARNATSFDSDGPADHASFSDTHARGASEGSLEMVATSDSCAFAERAMSNVRTSAFRRVMFPSLTRSDVARSSHRHSREGGNPGRVTPTDGGTPRDAHWIPAVAGMTDPEAGRNKAEHQNWRVGLVFAASFHWIRVGVSSAA